MELRTDPVEWGYGLWTGAIIDSLYTRTDASIDSFIESKVLLFISLLCSDCSEEAIKKIKKRHPREYRNVRDSRGERVGMFMWIVDLHNDVNEHLKKPTVSFNDVRDAFAAIYYKTTKQIDEAKKNAADPDRYDLLEVTYIVPIEDKSTEESAKEINKPTTRGNNFGGSGINRPKTITRIARKPVTGALSPSRIPPSNIGQKRVFTPATQAKRSPIVNATTPSNISKVESTGETPKCTKCGGQSGIARKTGNMVAKPITRIGTNRVGVH